MDRQQLQGNVMNDRMDDVEWISALADGQYEGEDLVDRLEALAGDPQAREAWQAYHLIGDVLRSPDLAGATEPTVFLARLSRRLADEEAIPRTLTPEPADCAAPTRGEAANDRAFRWKRVAVVASLLLATASAWLVADAWRVPAQPQLAKDEAGRMWRDARLDDFLAAHRLTGAATALQAPAGFLHPAAFERPATGR